MLVARALGLGSSAVDHLFSTRCLPHRPDYRSLGAGGFELFIMCVCLSIPIMGQAC